MMDAAPEISVCDDTRKWLDENYRYDLDEAEAFAEDRYWQGFAFVMTGDGGPFSMSDEYVSGHECEHFRQVSNAEEAQKILTEATGQYLDSWAVFDEFAGCLAYDYANDRAREAAEGIRNRLADYPLLNDEDYGEREREAAIRSLAEQHKLENDVAEELLIQLHSMNYGDTELFCGNCGTIRAHDDVPDAMASIGYHKCVDCDEWLKTDLEKPLCYDCARSYRSRDCGCVAEWVDHAERIGRIVDRATVKSWRMSCGQCYVSVYSGNFES